MENIEVTQENKERMFINILRGVAIFLMIWQHCVQHCIPDGIDFFENYIVKFICSFHMPLFMLISGYLFYASLNKREFKEIINHRVKSLLHVAVVGGIFIWLLTDMILNIALKGYHILVGGKWLSSITSLWFIWSVLVSTLIVSFAYKKVNKAWLRILCLIFGVFIVLFFPAGELNLYMYPYFLIGFFYAKHREKFNSIIFKVIKHLMIPIFIVLFLFYEKRHYIYTSGIFCIGYSFWEFVEINLFRWLIGLVGSIAVIDICKLVFDLFMRKRTTMPKKNPLAYLGEKSLQMYVLQSIIVTFWLKWFYQILGILFPAIHVFFAEHIIIYNGVFSIGIAVICTFVTYLFNKLLEDAKISKFIFKR